MIYETLIEDPEIADQATGKIKFYEFPDSQKMDEGPYIIIEPLDIPRPIVFGDNQRLKNDSLYQIETWSKNRLITREIAEKIESLLWEAGFVQTGGVDEYDAGVFRDARRFRKISYSDDFILKEITMKHFLTGSSNDQSISQAKIELRKTLSADVLEKTSVSLTMGLKSFIPITGETKSNTSSTATAIVESVFPSKPNAVAIELYNAVRVDWNPTTNTDSYKVYRASDPANLGTTLIEITDGTTTYTDATAVGGVTYYYTVKAINVRGSKNSDKLEATPSSVQTYENHLVDFEGYPAWAIYDEAATTKDFGNVSTLQGGDRLKTDTTGRLRFYLPNGMLGSANTGGIIKAAIVPKNEYTIEYEIRFDTGFPWSMGGKVPGFSGGAGYTGGSGDGARSGDGFSVRMMWREGGRIIPYLYHAGMTGDFGDTFGKTLGYFTDTKAHKVKYYAKLNTGSDQNGILRIYLDDVQVFEKENLLYRTDDSKIDTVHISIFAGGSTPEWNMTGDGYIRLSYISWD